MDNTSSSRSTKIDDLSKDTPNVPRSFLDRLSDKVLAIITPKEVTELYDVQRVGSGHNSGATASSPLDLSQVSQLIDQAANELRLATPETFVKPVLRVGSGSLTPKDMEILRNYRKDTRGFSSLEGTLEFYNVFLSDLPSPISDEEAVKGLFVIAPSICLPTLETLRFRKMPIVEVYGALQTLHGSRKNLDELTSAIENILNNKDNKKPLDVLEELGSIVLKSSSSQKDMDDTCIREARRFLKGIGGEGLWNSVSAHFHNTHGRHYRDLVRILKESFTETLNDIWEKKGKIRNITLDSKDNGTELKKPDCCTDTINRLFGMNASPGPCFGCGAPGHIRAACPSGGNKPPSTKNFKNSRTPVKVNLNLPYCDQTCSIHLGGIHLNSVCKLQIKNPCQVHHGAHSQSSCKQVGLQKPQGLFPQGGYRPPNQNNPPNPTPVPNPVWNSPLALIPPNPNPPPLINMQKLHMIQAIGQILENYLP